MYFASTPGVEGKYRYRRNICVTSSVVSTYAPDTDIVWLCTAKKKNRCQSHVDINICDYCGC